MDNFQLVSQARLTQVRFATIRAQRPKIGASGGSVLMQVSTSVGHNPEKPSTATARLIMDVRGIAKDAAADSDDYEFRVELELRGVYQWRSEIEAARFEPREISAILCQPLFLLAAKKAESLIAGLGARGVKLDPDLRLTEEDPTSLQPKSANGKKPSGAKRAARVQVRKAAAKKMS